MKSFEGVCPLFGGGEVVGKTRLSGLGQMLTSMIPIRDLLGTGEILGTQTLNPRRAIGGHNHQSGVRDSVFDRQGP